jgi:hypothetical protein
MEARAMRDNDTPDRQQMHEDLRELAKLAGTPAPSSTRDKSHGFQSADSSGYVDLSAYRADDESWIERELARAKAGGPAPTQRTIDGLAPQSMAPVALEALLAADTKVEDEAPPRRRWPLAVGGVASALAVAALAVVVARNAPHAAPKATQAAAEPPTPAVATAAALQTPEPTATQAAETAQQAPSATALASAQDTSSPPVTKKAHATHASRWHAPAASPAGVAVAAKPAARPVAIPASTPSKSSGDSLMDAIRASVKK